MLDRAVELAIRITENGKEAAAGLAETKGEVSGLGRAGSIAGKALAVGLAGAAFAAVKCSEAAVELQTNQNSLNDSAKKVAGASAEQVKAMDEWAEAQGRAKGVTSGELLPSLTKLINATHSVKDAQRDESLAMDIAAKTHKSLDSVTQSLAKSISTGSVAALGKYQVATKDATGHALTNKQVMQELADTYGGSAAKAADTAAGKQRVLAVETEQLKEKIGSGLLPVEGKLVGITLSIVGAMADHSTTTLIVIGSVLGLLAAVKLVSAATAIWSAGTKIATGVQAAYNFVTGIGNTTLGTRIGVMAIDAAAWVRSTATTVANTVATTANTVATEAWSIASKAAAAAQWLLNAAMDANPVTLIVIGVAALVAVLILAYKHSATFRAIVQGAFHAVAAAAGAAVSFIRDHWKLLLAILIGPIGLAVFAIATHWSQIKDGAAAVLGWIRERWPAIKAQLTLPFTEARDTAKAVWKVITSGLADARDTISTIATAIQTALVGAFNAISTAVQGAIDKIVAIIRKVEELIGKAKSIGGGLLGAVGLRTSVGFGGSSPTSGVDAIRQDRIRDVHVHVQGGYVGNEVQLARVVRAALDADQRRLRLAG